MSTSTLAGRIAESVQKTLDDLDVSGAELARRLGATQPYVWRRLNGEVEFSLTDLENVAQVLGVPVSRLIPVGRGRRLVRYEDAA